MLFSRWLHQFAFTTTVWDFSASLPTSVVSCVVNFSHSDRCEVVSHLGLTSIFLIMSAVEHLFMSLLTIWMLL